MNSSSSTVSAGSSRVAPQQQQPWLRPQLRLHTAAAMMTTCLAVLHPVTLKAAAMARQRQGDGRAAADQQQAGGGTAGRSARAGRSLRDMVPKRKQVLQFAEPQARRQQHLSKKKKQRQQRQQQEERRRQQQQRTLERQRQQQHEAELQAALRAAASGRLTRHSVKMIGDLDDPVATAAAAAAEVVGSALQSLSAAGDAAAEDEHMTNAARGAAPAAAGLAEVKQEDRVKAAAAAAKPLRGLKGELMRLQEQLQGFKEFSRDGRDKPSALQQWEREQQRRRRSRQDLGGRYSGSSDDRDDDQDDDDVIGSGDDADEEMRRQQQPGSDAGAAAAARGSCGSPEDDGDDGDDGDEDEVRLLDDEGDEEGDEEGQEQGREARTVRKRYLLRSRERQSIQRYSPRHVSAAGTKPTGGSSVRGSGERRRDRDRDRERYRDRERDRGRGGGRHRRSSGFGDGGSSSEDYGDLLGRAAGGVSGLYYTPGIAPNALSTPAAAVAAAAAAAATGLISPKRGLERRSSCLLGDAAATAVSADPAGAGWGQWGAGGAAGAGAAECVGPFSGVIGRDAAATAGGREGRGGLGQELITPLQVDASIGFDQVGGLDQYLAALKEMIFLPLLYPELFEKFGVNPPRGVLFHGPPGTGKTLVARALAAQASKAAGQKVAFYMRKGADLLSKWVGEAEKQLRLLFEEAALNQPAIIFFDEIDGLAPVRTSKQDQVHNSIVSTLLALMDGLESRGRVVLIGATNRPDALDPALRRPGRFDRELLFPLPDLAARRTILGIHSRAWSPRPGAALLDELARLTGGYCGADIKALCAEASLAALRRVYPQVYDSDCKLLINPAAVIVNREDFMTAMQGMTPAAHRATSSHARALTPVIEPCLSTHLQAALLHIQQLFPPAAACLAAAADAAATEANHAGDGTSSSATLPQQGRLSAAITSKRGVAGNSGGKNGITSGSASSTLFCMARPRMLLAGAAGSGQQQLGAAVLAALEGLPVHGIGLPSLLASASSRCVEEALVSTFTEARRAAPAILYWPQAHLWWAAAGSGLRCALIALLDDLPPDLPLLLLATAELAADPAAAAAEAAEADGAAAGSAAQHTQQQLTLAAAEAGSGSGAQQLQQQQQCLESLGLEPSLAALFPALGSLEELLHSPQQQQQQQQPAGCGVLGRVLLGRVGPAQRQEMFKGVLDAAAAPPPLAAAPSQQPPPPELPQAPEAAAAAEAAKAAAAAAAARAAYEQDQAVLRSLRIVLRSIVTRALAQKRYRLYAEPPLLDEEGGFEALQALSCPMDLLTMLYKVDHQQYLTPAAFLADAHLIVRCAEELYGEPEAAAAAAAALPAHVAAAVAGGSSGAADGAAADTHAGGRDPAAAAAAGGGGADGGLPVLTRSLPAVRLAVCKEISRAMELRDELETQIYQLLPPELVRSCEAVAAKGGPASPPPGMALPHNLLPPAAAAARGTAGGSSAATGAGGKLGGSGGDGSSKPTRSAARLTGKQLDKRMMHADPEALMRALKARPARPKQPAAAAAAAGPNEDEGQHARDKEQEQGQQQPRGEEEDQEHQEQAAAADDDVEMADAAAVAGHPAVEPAAPPAAPTPPASTEAAGTPVPAAAAAANAAGASQRSSPLALKPVTNGQSKKRPATNAADGERPAKVAASATEQWPQQQQDWQLPAAVVPLTAGAEAAPADPVAVTAAAAAPKAADVAAAGVLLQQLVTATSGMQLASLELLHARLSRLVAANAKEEDRQVVLQRVGRVVAAVEREQAGASLSIRHYANGLEAV
ncbi:hypothetical protein COO60DRAFT_1699727 [Scenedesmus sp. NREL 46B-D3]|nr:hypothetical protein COO60DRAFT_1699727 [Scenedesmus sp. NREL 46B-D3]